jgi:hypothetical protein
VWWTTAQLTPSAESIATLPVARIDPTWSRATVLTLSLLPRRAEEDLWADTPHGGFVCEGDFNRDGRKDRAFAGIYETKSGGFGRFLLILTESTPGRWEKAFLDAEPGEAGFSVLWPVGGGLGWSFCPACDTWTHLVWADTGYVFRDHTGSTDSVIASAHEGGDSATITRHLGKPESVVIEDTCPAGALVVARALLTADTLGVGVGSASLDSSRIDTLMTLQYEGAPDMSYVVTAITLSCELSRPDSAVFRAETRQVGMITSTDTSYGMVFVPRTATLVGHIDVVRRSGQWKVLGPYAAVSLSPAAALRRFDLPAESRRALERLLHRGKS